MTDPPMYNVASAVFCRSLAIVRSLPLPGCGSKAVRYFFVDHLCFFCLVFVMLLCASVYLCLVVTCWERADLFALVCGV